MKRVTSFAIAMAAIVGVATMGVGVLHAASNTSDTNRMGNLVSALAQKFNLNPTDIQQVFDQQHQQMKREMRVKGTAEQKAILDQAVKGGKITQVQEDLIFAKQAELKIFMDSLNAKTQTERRAAMKTEMDTLTKWAKDNGIPEQYLPHGGGNRMGGMGHMHKGNQHLHPKK